MAYFLGIGGGLLLGLVVGRWWALLAAAGLGVWVGVGAEVEVSSWLLGVGYAILAAGGIIAGVLLRRLLARDRAAGDA
jgi:hypothetical protein